MSKAVLFMSDSYLQKNSQNRISGKKAKRHNATQIDRNNLWHYNYFHVRQVQKGCETYQPVKAQRGAKGRHIIADSWQVEMYGWMAIVIYFDFRPGGYLKPTPFSDL